MSKVIKQLLKVVGILIVSLVLFAGFYKGAKVVKTHLDNRRIASIYQTLMKTGRIRTSKNTYVYLTPTGRSLIKPDLTFSTTKDKKNPPATAYIVDETCQVSYNYVQSTTLPNAINKGTTLTFNTPFSLVHSPKFKLNIPAGTVDTVHYQDGNLNLPTKHNKKSKIINVILGFNVDKDGNLINDIPPLSQYAGKNVAFQVLNQVSNSTSKKTRFKKLAKTPNIDLPVSWLENHAIQSNFSTTKSVIQPKIQYQAKVDGKDVTSHLSYQIKLKKIRHFEKDWVVNFKIDNTGMQLLENSKSKRLQLTTAYYGKAVDAYYYAGNSMSGVYRYPRS